MSLSTNAALAAAGYTTAPSPTYGCKLILRDGDLVGHFDAVTAWTLPGMADSPERVRADLDDLLAEHAPATPTV